MGDIIDWKLSDQMEYVRKMLRLTYIKHIVNNKMFLRIYDVKHGSQYNQISVNYGATEILITEKSTKEYLIEYFNYVDGDRLPIELRKPTIQDTCTWIVDEIKLYLSE